VELILHKIKLIKALKNINEIFNLIKIYFFEIGIEEFIFKKNRKWQKVGLDIHRFAKIYDSKFKVYENEISLNKSDKIN